MKARAMKVQWRCNEGGMKGGGMKAVHRYGRRRFARETPCVGSSRADALPHLGEVSWVELQPEGDVRGHAAGWRRRSRRWPWRCVRR